MWWCLFAPWAQAQVTLTLGTDHGADPRGAGPGTLLGAELGYELHAGPIHLRPEAGLGWSLTSSALAPRLGGQVTVGSLFRAGAYAHTDPARWVVAPERPSPWSAGMLLDLHFQKMDLGFHVGRLSWGHQPAGAAAGAHLGLRF